MSLFSLTGGAAGGTGNEVGPASSTDNAVARFDGTTGKLLQDSVVTVSDTGDVAGIDNLSAIDGNFSGDLSVSGGLTLGTSLNVNQGGTGVATLTNHGVVIGQGASAVAVTAAGTAGQVLTSNGASADPTFQTLGTIQTANGAQWIWSNISELLVLSTSGTTTNTTANLLPANAIIEAVVARVTTTIATATSWQLGDPTTAGRFTNANSTLAAGTTDIGLKHMQGSITTDAAGPVQTTANKVRVTTVGTPSAGAIRITVFYRQFVAPTS